ncbi:MAG: phytanoyl-CoA dioxygenase family protein [Pseudomonadota bacterium]
MQTDTQEAGLAPYLGRRSFADWKDEYDRTGYVIFENVLSPEQVAAQRAALQPYLGANIQGRNDFEGLKSNRIYAMLGKDSAFAKMVAHPLSLAFVEAELGPNALLSACLAINLHPGETVQPWHTDDGHIRIPAPRPSYGVSTFWALDDTTETNGATEVLPGSHLWDRDAFEELQQSNAFDDRAIRDVHDDPYARSDAIKATMPAGSLMIAKGTLWHRGGANHSDKARLIVTPQYCPAWARPLETMLLAVPPEKAAQLPPKVQELLGYSIHPPFMGYVDGRHPRRTLPSQ